MGSSLSPRNLHEPGGVRRATSASSAAMRRASRSTCSMDSLNRARSGSGKFAGICPIAKASAIMRSSFRCRGFSRSQSRRFALRFRPSHSSPVLAGLAASGSAGLLAAEVAAAACGFFIRNNISCSSRPSYSCRVLFSPFSASSVQMFFHFCNASILSPLICPSISTRPVTRIARVSNTNPP